MMNEDKLNEAYKDMIIGESIVDSGNYITLEVMPNGLKVSITPEGLEKAEEEGLKEQNFYDFIEDIITNSEWRWFEDLGEGGFGLTNAPGFTNGYYEDEEGDFDLYYYEKYQIRDFTVELLKNGYVIFDKAE
jgi:hypothetical protein